MAFRLFDEQTVGIQIGSPISNSVTVFKSLFITALDFGGTAFDGNARWLDIQVNCANAFVTLTLRQPLTATPYASYAIVSGKASDLQGVPISTTPATTGQALGWDGSSFTPQTTVGSPGPQGLSGPTGLTGPQGIPGVITPSTGLALSGGVISLTLPYQLPQNCSGGQTAKWNSARWVCTDDSGWNLQGNEGISAA